MLSCMTRRKAGEMNGASCLLDVRLAAQRCKPYSLNEF